MGNILVKLKAVCLRNFRRLEDVEISFEDEETIFVGPNNSGKTSATEAFRLFLGNASFTIHDFSVSRTGDIDRFGSEKDADESILPTIEMDLWFSVDPETEYGRVCELIPNLSQDFTEVGIRMTYCVKDAGKLKSDYLSSHPPHEEGERHKSLSQFLSLHDNLNRHFTLRYSALELTDEDRLALPREPEEGKRVLRSLIRVDFVSAQRNFDDQEVARSNRLSSAFATFYKKNLEIAEVNHDANRVIDENNERLNDHYAKHFTSVMQVIKGLGVPAVNDREIRIVSNLSPEVALQGNTSLLYVDPLLGHELPEKFNGLGFKNLIYMAIQISHFHLQWMNSELPHPLCQVIFIEEPEVHLHAQVQQTFISNVWRIVKNAADEAKNGHMIPQLGITTHSSHILDAAEFRKIRYFQRCPIENDTQAATILNASKVLSLRNFKPLKKSSEGKIEDEKTTLDFLKRYLKLTHCDLFFADAAVLLEGTAEKLLLPRMIEQSAPGLRQNYLTLLEVGGAYAHRFASLMEFLDIPYLVITDIDSVDPLDNCKVCRADKSGAQTSNAALNFFFGKSQVSELIALEDHCPDGNNCYIAFQEPTGVVGHSGGKMHGRTFEEAFIYQNMSIFRDGELQGIDIPTGGSFEEEYKAVFERVKSPSFKKTDFALRVASLECPWATPQYIKDGLIWLEGRVAPNTVKYLIN